MDDGRSCSKCARDAVRSIGAKDYCQPHLDEILTPIRARVAQHDIEREPFNGHGRQDGPLRPEWGDDWAELRCDRCSATWVGVVGEPCSWCDRQYGLLLEAHRSVLLHPELPELDDERRRAAELAWVERLGRAVKAGIVDRPDALASIDRHDSAKKPQ